jgi:hypothetical protein
MRTRSATHVVKSDFWDEIKARVTRIQEITESQGITGTHELLASTKELIDQKPSQSSMESLNEGPSPHPFNSIRPLHESSLNSSFSSEIAGNTISMQLKSQFLKSRYDEEITHIKEEAHNIHDELKKRLSAFRKATQGFSATNDRTQAELEWYKDEMVKLKRAIYQLLEDTQLTRLELARAREGITNSQVKERQFDLKDLDFSPDINKDHNYSSISEKILELYKEINEINEKVIETDETRLKLERENQVLKDVVMKLQDSVVNSSKPEGPEALKIEEVASEPKGKGWSCNWECAIF